MISWAAGQRLEVQLRFVAVAAPPSDAQLAQLEAALRQVLSAAPRDHPAVLTLGASEANDGWLLVVFPTYGSTVRQEAESRPGESIATGAEPARRIRLKCSADDDQTMVEISWTGSSSVPAGDLPVELAPEPGLEPLGSPAEPGTITLRDRPVPASS